MKRLQTSEGPRYVWHPQVHERQHERCNFYLLRAPDAEAHVALVGSLNSLFRAESITSHSIYGIYGFHDVLVRVWTTETSRRRFLRALLSSPHNPVELLSFAAERIYYGFGATGSADLSAIVRRHTDNIRTVEIVDENDGWVGNEEAERAFDALLQTDPPLLLKVPSTELAERGELPGIKVYLILSRSQESTSSLSDEWYTSSMRNAGFESVSAYFGAGTLGSVLLKGVFEEPFHLLWSALSKLHDEFAASGYRSMSFPIANQLEVVESDTIDSIRLPSSPRLDDLYEELVAYSGIVDEIQQATIRRGIGELPASHSQRLGELFVAITAGFHDSTLYSRLLRFLRGSLIGDEDVLEDSIAFIPGIERDMRYCIPQVLSRQWGDGWISRFMQPLVETPDDSNFIDGERQVKDMPSLRSLSLRGLFLGARHAAKSDAYVADTFNTVLGLEWESKIRTVSDLRNDFAHGRIVNRETYRDFSGDWGDVVLKVIDAASISRGLQELRKSFEA